MKRPKRISIRNVLQNEEWAILQVIECDGKYRIEARRPPVKHQLNYFVGYGGKQYVEQLSAKYRKTTPHKLVSGDVAELM